MPSKKASKKTKEEIVPETLVEKKPATKKEKTIKPKVSLVSFSVTAVIPTQQYGNIQPKIEVQATSIDEARAVVMPVIEDMYRMYAEKPINGRDPVFLGKVTETVKTVDVNAVQSSVPTPAVLPAAHAEILKQADVVQPPKEPTPETVTPATPTVTGVTNRPEPYQKAYKAINLAASHDALNSIKAQIEKSVKIDPADKPELLEILSVKYNELPF